eukprot:TRINITY_DN7647_c0_g1_i4.p1 TRINITY_DN7647_c0_g1~~TRINITY_DN7647_c0_g1_i4.p1  ORF type:complete len:141 (-),score=26.46 TRINITY_DN7647_c0_g1_i4:257-679(-)
MMAILVGPAGRVIGIDIEPNLLEEAEENVRKHHSHLLDSGRLELKRRDGWRGVSEMAPFDAIHVGAAAETIPKALVDQLSLGGSKFTFLSKISRNSGMVIPVGPFSRQRLLCVDKDKADGSIVFTELGDVAFVPLQQVIM